MHVMSGCRYARHSYQVTRVLRRFYSTRDGLDCKPPYLTAFSRHSKVAVEDQYGRHTYGSLLVQSHNLAERIKQALGLYIDNAKYCLWICNAESIC